MIHKEHLLSISNDKLRRLATYASVSVASILIAAKLVAYFMTDSVAVLSSLLDSTIDLLASLVTAFGVASALRPPDRDHRFGHGKAEPLAALAQAAFIIGSSVLLGYEALGRIYHPHTVQNENVAYIVMAVATVLTIVLINFQHIVVRRTSSIAIHADRLHYAGDLIINVAVAAAFALHQWTGMNWFDPVFAMAIATGLILTALNITREALNVLMDKELPDADRARIREIVMSVPSVKGVHDLRTRSDSDRVFMELHVEMDGNLPLRETHGISEDIVKALGKAFPHADVTIHQDPAGHKEDRLDTQIAAREARGKALPG